jgi:hypothetical protein
MKQWSELSAALTRKEVRKLLGEPATVDLIGDGIASSAEAWNFDYEIVDGSNRSVQGTVVFSYPEGRILRWSEPDWAQFE